MYLNSLKSIEPHTGALFKDLFFKERMASQRFREDETITFQKQRWLSKIFHLKNIQPHVANSIYCHSPLWSAYRHRWSSPTTTKTSHSPLKISSQQSASQLIQFSAKVISFVLILDKSINTPMLSIAKWKKIRFIFNMTSTISATRRNEFKQKLCYVPGSFERNPHGAITIAPVRSDTTIEPDKGIKP